MAGDSLNLVTQRANTEVRKNFWSLRVVGPWNRLPAAIKRAKNTETFKSLYDAHVATMKMMSELMWATTQCLDFFIMDPKDPRRLTSSNK